MKKRLAVLMTLCLMVSMSACSDNEKGRGTYNEDIKASEKEEKEDKKEKDDKKEKEEKDDKKSEEEPAEDPEDVIEEEIEEEVFETGDLVFETVDITGKKVDQDIIKGSKLVLLNLWEPWCGPCVNEMPDLEALYENYKDEGLIILGAYTTFDMDAEAKELADSYGITYPILKADENLYSYEQSYVPATFIFDGHGNLLDRNPVEGSQSYYEWESIVKKYLSD